MRSLSYLALGVVGTLAYMKMQDGQPMLGKQMRKMMKNNQKTFKKIREIM